MGFWGPITSSVDWCEDNYEVTHYVAEFMNTLSSIPVAIMGLVMLRQAIRENKSYPLRVASVAMTVVGVGSASFHGTLTREGQMLDELPMVWGICSYLYAILYHMDRNMDFAMNVTVVWAILATVLYFVLGFVAFVVMFTTTVVVTMGAAVVATRPFRSGAEFARNANLKSNLAWTAGLVYLFALLGLWLPEQYLCGNRLERSDTPHPIVQGMHFHAMFHLLSALAPYLFLCFILVLENETALKRTSDLVWKGTAETACVPVPVVVCHTSS